MKIDLTYNFEVEHQGRNYHCTRTIIGTKGFYEQFIRIENIGTKKDAQIYRTSLGEALDRMVSSARLVAHEIIEEYLKEISEV